MNRGFQEAAAAAILAEDRGAVSRLSDSRLVGTLWQFETGCADVCERHPNRCQIGDSMFGAETEEDTLMGRVDAGAHWDEPYIDADEIDRDWVGKQEGPWWSLSG